MDKLTRRDKFRQSLIPYVPNSPQDKPPTHPIEQRAIDARKIWNKSFKP